MKSKLIDEFKQFAMRGNVLDMAVGVVIGGVFMHFDINQSSVQLALLFGTTLAPISGYFGWPFGVLAGFLHSSVVLYTGTPVAGMNLYNNGFAGGIVAIFMVPVIQSVRDRRARARGGISL